MTLPDLISRLSLLDTPAISDALDALDLSGIATGLSPLTLPARIAGRVVTVKLGPAGDSTPQRHLGATAVMAAGPGDVIVVEHGRGDVAGWGGLLSRGARRKGVAAVVIDGAARDIDEARAIGLPIFGRCAVPVTARGRVVERAFGEPIAIAGVTVLPGDLVIADGSGVAFIPAARAAEIIALAEDIAARERRMAAEIDAGRPIGEVLGAVYEDMLRVPSRDR